MKKNLKDLIVSTEINKVKLKTYLEQNPDQKKYETDVLENRVVIGMTYQMCLMSWGKPNNLSNDVSAFCDIKYLNYSANEHGINKTSLVFKDNILVSFSNRLPDLLGSQFDITMEDLESDDLLQYQYIHDIYRLKEKLGL